MKMKKRTLAARIGTFVAVCAGTLVASYALTPNRTISVNTGKKVDEQTGGGDLGDSYFGDFVNKLMRSFDPSSGEAFGTLTAQVQDLEVTWPSKSGLSFNDIKVDGLINLKMLGLQDLDLTIDLSADYNSKKLDLGIGLVEETLYLAIKDLRLKSPHSTSEQLVNTIDDLFFNPENPNGLGIGLNIGDTISGLFDNLDLSSISLDSLKFEETVVDQNVNIDLKIMEGIELKIVIDKETLGLRLVDLGTLEIGDVKISGKLVCDTPSDLEVLAFDDPNYSGTKRDNFIDVINYVGWADKILDLLQTKKVGLSLGASLTLDNDDSTVNKLADISAELNIDAENVFDIKNINLNSDKILKADDNSENNDEAFIDKLFNNLKFDASLSVSGQGDNEYANISLAYFDKAGYLALNETSDKAVMRAKIDVDTVMELVNKIPEMIDSLTNGDEAANDDSEGLFDFVTSSELVVAIKDGRYDGILDLIETLKSYEDKIEIVLSLSSLGFGDDATVSLILNAGEDAIQNGSKVLDIAIKNAEIGNLNLDLSLSTNSYSDVRLNKIVANKDKYDDLSFVTGVFDQVTTILDTKSAYVGLEGSILDADGLGFTFDGWAQFKVAENYGFGSATFYEYKTSSTKISAEHKVDIDVNNAGDDDREKNMLFEYRDSLRGKFTVQTLKDMIDLVKNLINENDTRFTKFIDPIKDMLLTGVLKEVIENKDYIALAKSSFIKSISQTNGGDAILIVIDKSILSLENDLTIKINLNSSSKHLDSIEILGLALGEKNVSLKVSVADYKENLTTPVNTKAAFYDFSDIAVLLQFGINTTKMNVYHLTMPITVLVGQIVPLNLNLNFYIEVNGKETKVYGKIPSVPWLSDFASDDLATVKVSSEFVFEPSHDASDNDIGGYFYIARTEDHWINRDDGTFYYRCDSKTFLANILQYLLCDLLNFKSSIVDSISNIETDPVEDSNYEDIFTDKGFTYQHTDSYDKWSMGLDLQALTGSSSLGELDLDLYGTEVDGVGYFSKAEISTVLVSVVSISGTLTLDVSDVSMESWPSSIESRYQTILNVYYNMSETNKASFDLNYFNKPTKAYKISIL